MGNVNISCISKLQCRWEVGVLQVLTLSSHGAAFVALKENQVANPEPELENFAVEELLIVRPTSPMRVVSAVPVEEFPHLFFLT